MHPLHPALSTHMGLIADVDVDSEVCRWFGPARYPLYTVIKQEGVESNDNESEHPWVVAIGA